MHATSLPERVICAHKLIYAYHLSRHSYSAIYDLVVRSRLACSVTFNHRLCGGLAVRQERAHSVLKPAARPKIHVFDGACDLARIYAFDLIG